MSEPVSQEATRHQDDAVRTKRQRRLQELAAKFGTLDRFMTQEELRRMREES